MILGDRGKLYASLEVTADTSGLSQKDLQNTENFLSAYEEYLIRALEYQKNRPTSLTYKLVPSKGETEQEDACWVVLKRKKGMNDATFQKVKNDFFNAEHVLDGKSRRGDTRQQEIRILDIDPDQELLKLQKKPQHDVLTLPPQVYVIDKQVNAIRGLINNPNIAYLPILRLLQPREDDVQVLGKICPYGAEDIEWEILDSEEFSQNDAYGTRLQKEFVKNALSTQDFCILNGPPGSGKTEAICELILQAAKRGEKILLCASTHTAVDNVLAKLKGRDDITAVRISSRESKVDERLTDYHINHRRDTERKRIIQYLEAEYPEDLSDAQNYFLSAVKSDSDIATDIILKSANLVCGTTVGILYHPAIRQMHERIEPLYDLLIIDEASRATFQEWLVPALFAKRWVIVGDPLQLPPFVDTRQLAANIRHRIEAILQESADSLDYERMSRICTDTAFCMRFKGSVLIVAEDPGIRDLYKRQASSIGARTFNIDEIGRLPDEEEYGIILCSKRNLDAYLDRILLQIIHASGENLDESIHSSAKENFERHTKKDYSFENNLEMALAWRTERIFQLRHFDETDGGPYNTRKRYLREREKLLPHPDHVTFDKIRKSLDELGSIPLPSVIELFIEGYPGEISGGKNCLTAGLTKHDLEQRYHILEYQHRSHDEIIKYPREMIYRNKGRDCLKSTGEISKRRDQELRITKYRNRAVWVTYTEEQTPQEKTHYINANEVDHIIDHLKDIISELSRIPPPAHCESWNIAVITFYLNQRDLLIRRVKDELDVSGHSIFSLKGGRITLTVSTVDGFQGHEADVVFLSVVNTDKIGFLDSLNRLNVALTRARHQMAIFGRRSYFAGQNESPILRELAKKKNPYYMKYQSGGTS